MRAWNTNFLQLQFTSLKYTTEQTYQLADDLWPGSFSFEKKYKIVHHCLKFLLHWYITVNTKLVSFSLIKLRYNQFIWSNKVSTFTCCNVLIKQLAKKNFTCSNAVIKQSGYMIADNFIFCGKPLSIHFWRKTDLAFKSSMNSWRL